MKQQILSVVILLGVIGIIIWVGFFALSAMPIAITSIQCCNGYTCTDRYYTAEDNLCHLSLCESSMFSSGECTYPGANKSITLLSGADK